MAPTKKDGEKEKKVKLTPVEASAALLRELRLRNRPYSATELAGNLKMPETQVKKTLKDMHERKEIDGRASGKALVYFPIQDEIEEDHEEKVKAMEEEAKQLNEGTRALKSEEKDLLASVRDNKVKVPLPQLKASVESMEKQKAEMEARLAKLKSGSLKPVTAGERNKVEKTYRKVKKSVASRKKIRVNLLRVIEDLAGKEKAEQTKEDLELEFD